MAEYVVKFQKSELQLNLHSAVVSIADKQLHIMSAL